MEEDLMAKRIVPATFNWPLRVKHFFYAHGGSLNPEDGSFVIADRLRDTAEQLETALQAIEQGTLKPNREKDELTFAPGTPEHIGHVRGMGVVPWKHGFSADINTYRSQSGKKAAEMAALAERVATIESQLAASSRQQDAASVPNVESSPGSQHRSSVASTEPPSAGQQHYPVDDLIVRTPSELLYQQRKKIKVVAHGIAKVPSQGGTIHGAPIPVGYARVMVDRILPGWEDLNLESLGGDGEQELQQALHTCICWDKRYIRISGRNNHRFCSGID